MANSTTRVLNIAMATGNKVNMAVINGLPSNLASVDADVEHTNGVITLRYRCLL